MPRGSSRRGPSPRTPRTHRESCAAADHSTAAGAGAPVTHNRPHRLERIKVTSPAGRGLRPDLPDHGPGSRSTRRGSARRSRLRTRSPARRRLPECIQGNLRLAQGALVEDGVVGVDAVVDLVLHPGGGPLPQPAVPLGGVVGELDRVEELVRDRDVKRVPPGDAGGELAAGEVVVEDAVGGARRRLRCSAEGFFGGSHAVAVKPVAADVLEVDVEAARWAPVPGVGRSPRAAPGSPSSRPRSARPASGCGPWRRAAPAAASQGRGGARPNGRRCLGGSPCREPLRSSGAAPP